MRNEHKHMDESHKEEKSFTIIVNSREHVVDDKKISYEEVIQLAGISATQNSVVTVTYERGEHGKEGSMTSDDIVNVKARMVFNVATTNKS
jgi:hypothetical protein